MKNIDFFSEEIETKSFIPLKPRESWAYEYVNDFVSIASNAEKSAAQGANKGLFCMGILF